MRRIYVDMVGDLFHQGHVEILKSARAMGDFLIVGVLSDSVVASYKRLPNVKTHDIAIVVHDNNISAEAIQEVYGAPH